MRCFEILLVIALRSMMLHFVAVKDTDVEVKLRT